MAKKDVGKIVQRGSASDSSVQPERGIFSVTSSESQKPGSPFLSDTWSEHRGLGVLGDTKSHFTVDTGKNIATMHVPHLKGHSHDTASAFVREAPAARVQ